jgi:hypothetical protein
MTNDRAVWVLDRLYTALEGANCKEMQTIWTHKIQQFKNQNGGYDVNDEENKREA